MKGLGLGTSIPNAFTYIPTKIIPNGNICNQQAKPFWSKA